MNGAIPLPLGLHYYETLLAIAETESVTAAAERLDVTQAAVSHRIAAMNRIAQRRLVYRGKGGMKLTDDGRMLAQATRHALRALADVDAAVLGDDEVPPALSERLERDLLRDASANIEAAGLVLRLVRQERGDTE